MKINFILLIIAVALAVGLTLWLDKGGVSSNKTSIAPNAVQGTGEMVPEFSFIDIRGRQYDSKQFHGHVVLINFWATWCAPCVIEFPKLIQLAKDNPDMIVIALSSDVSNDKIIHFLRKQPRHGSNFIIARDIKRKITADIFKTYKLPETIIVAPNGEIMKKIVGDTDWLGEEMVSYLKSLEDR
jgi:cytochrome c biogenesis protein CcmG/thiol:disulfide interchange protein DsbE